MNALPSAATLPGTYPGARAVEAFGPADDATLWVIDFHAPNGLTPLGLSMFEIVMRASRAAADGIPMPGTRGLVGRAAGSHPYVSLVAVEPAEAATRARRGAQRLPGLLDGAHAAWTRAAAELSDRAAALAAQERAVRSLADAQRFLAAAFDAAEHAWRVHFDFMYPLLAGYLEFLERAGALGIPIADVPPLLQGFPTRITETDRAIWDLATAARELGVGDAIATGSAPELVAWLRSGDGAVARFRELVDAFLDVHGQRTEGIYEPALVPWADDPGSLLARVALVLDEVRERAFADIEAASAAARREAELEVMRRLPASARAEFERALAAVRAANFAWWNEDHNVPIDLRTHIPVRRAALAVGAAAGLPRPDDALFLFRPELETLAPEALALVPPRRALHARWAGRRSELPQLVGTPPERIDDPVLREIFGIGDEILGAARPTEPLELHGIAASGGVVRGNARVLRDPAELETLRPREVIVCEATTPSWTPAFAAAAGCVCDQGGSLTHAAIVSREYGVPCVTGTLRATDVIATGDLVEVDGDAGRVRVLRRRAADPGG